MTTLTKITALFTLMTIFAVSSCTKEAEQEQNPLLGSFFSYETLTEPDYAYGFKTENGVPVQVPESDIDLDWMQQADGPWPVIEIEIRTESRLDYSIYVPSPGNIVVPTFVETEYTFDDNLLTFNYLDEWGNEDPIVMRYENGQLSLLMVAYVSTQDDTIEDLEQFWLAPNRLIVPEDARNRLSPTEGAGSYAIVFEKMYTTQ